ncbi:hypothetical protein OAQ01_04990 [Emcibacteraceae bacterium]|nr:hypothetical protein [Emcibacteraceae bacterium]
MDKAKPPRSGITKFFYSISVIFVWGSVLMVPVLIYFSYDLPDIANIDKATSKTTIMIMDRDGNRMASYGDVFGEWLDYEDIPPRAG